MKKHLYVLIVSAAALVIAGVMLFQSSRIRRLEYTIAETSRSALHQTAEEMNALAIDMEKTLLARGSTQSATLLNTVSRTADDVQRCLAALPVEQHVLQPAMQFVNRLAAYSEQLIPQATASGGLPAEEARLFARQLTLCAQLCGQLALAEEPADLAALAVDESLLLPAPPAAQALGLPQGDITQEDALDIARRFVDSGQVTEASAAPGTSGPLAAYGVTIRTADLQLNLEITRQGGKVLWMMPETAGFPITQSLQACVDAASAFLASRDFGAMEAIFHQVYDGMCVITFVPVQEDVLLYPDLLRVQVRMDTAQIVGLEAHQYWLNHTRRDLPAPTISAEQGAKLLSSRADVTGTRLCVIPQSTGEILCHEFTVTHDDDTYLIYIDATSGQELQILKAVPLENGSLIV